MSAKNTSNKKLRLKKFWTRKINKEIKMAAKFGCNEATFSLETYPYSYKTENKILTNYYNIIDEIIQDLETAGYNIVDCRANIWSRLEIKW